MNTLVIEHVKLSELPEAWRKQLPDADIRVTVRIEEETPSQHLAGSSQERSDNPLFGMWQDREEMADVDQYVRKLRASRF